MRKLNLMLALIFVGLSIVACTNQSGCTEGRGIGGDNFRDGHGNTYRWCARWY